MVRCNSFKLVQTRDLQASHMIDEVIAIHSLTYSVVWSGTLTVEMSEGSHASISEREVLYSNYQALVLPWYHRCK